MKSDLVLTFTSPDRPGVVERLTKVVVAGGGNWEESRLARLCGDFAGIARISVAADRSDTLRRELESLCDSELQISVRQSDRPVPSDCSRYEIICNGADHEGIVNQISGFLASNQINVEELTTTVEAAPTTGTPVFNMSCRVAVPKGVDWNALDQQLKALAAEQAVDVEVR
ncbi:MAG TPA: glycine cleavage system protein R [Planctomycetaceae bacterium]|nr:glycine cleavage system protein R [Planctomycetaceae bacterium]